MGYKVAVLMGGKSFEREFSLLSGKNVCKVLEEAGHEVVPLDTTSDLVETLRAEKVDVAYVALHGKHGEDGTIQSLLEYLEIPYIGCTAPICRIARNKSNMEYVLMSHRAHLKAMAQKYDKELDSPCAASWPRQICMFIDAFKEMGAASALDLINEKFNGFPLVVKPARGGSAMGLHKVACYDKLAPAILDALSYDTEVIIGQWVDGIELGVSVIERADGSLHVLPPVEISTTHEYFDTSARLESGEVEYYAPPRGESISSIGESGYTYDQIMQTVKDCAVEVFQAFGCRDMARIDMIWDGQHAQVIELDVSPGMSDKSLLPAACNAQGITLADLISEQLQKAVERKS